MGIEIYCTKLNNTAWEHWSTLYRNWTTLHGSTDLHFTETEQHCTGALIYTLQKLNNNTREHWSTLYRTEQHSPGDWSTLCMMRLFAIVTLCILCLWLLNKLLIISICFFEIILFFFILCIHGYFLFQWYNMMKFEIAIFFMLIGFCWYGFEFTKHLDNF